MIVLKLITVHFFFIFLDSFMIVDCGGGTVDLTTRKLLEGQKLGEITEAKGYYYGGSFVDEEFIKFLGRKVGSSAIKLLNENNYSQLQYMVQEFCRRVKFPFTDKKADFKPFNLDLEGMLLCYYDYINIKLYKKIHFLLILVCLKKQELCPVIKQYVKGSERDEMEQEEWTIELKFEDVERMFDPLVKKILDAIIKLLDASNNDVSAILLFGDSVNLNTCKKKLNKNSNTGYM